MTSTAPIPGPAPETTPVQPAQAPTQAQTQQAQAAAAANQGTSQAPATQTGSDADLRLVIEDDKAAGSYVYVTINSVTGKVVSQIPREQLLKMREDPDYKPGSVIDKRS
jgi:flagellar protein FlaG